MASFAASMDVLRRADDLGLARILVVLKKAYQPPPKPVQGFPVLMTRFRTDSDDLLRQLLDELTEQYINNTPNPDKPDTSRRLRGLGGMAMHMADERAAGRPRPNRASIESQVRNSERISDRQLQADLIDSYDIAAEMGVVTRRA